MLIFVIDVLSQNIVKISAKSLEISEQLFFFVSLYVFLFLVLSKTVLDDVVSQVFPVVVEDHPPVRTDEDPLGGGGDVHHDVDS